MNQSVAFALIPVMNVKLEIKSKAHIISFFNFALSILRQMAKEIYIQDKSCQGERELTDGCNHRELNCTKAQCQNMVDIR